MMRWSVVVLVLGSCGRIWSEEDFIEEFPMRMCDRAVACGWQSDYDVCVEARAEAIALDQFECADYESSAVDDCFREIRGLSCDSLEYGEPGVHPFTCRVVFDCSFNPQ